MSISPKSTKILWANATGRCSFAGCTKKLFKTEDDGVAPYTIGEMAHICGEKPDANRHNRSLTVKQRDDYSNLILLCPNHHTEIDKKENESVYSVITLKTMKSDHETSMGGRLEHVQFANKCELARYVSPLFAENRTIFINFGPHSDIARKHPESDAHRVWMSERFSTLIPNNRKIAAAFDLHRNLFASEELSKIADFLLHVRSYERWVNDEITYEGVIRFSSDIQILINEAASG